METITVYHGTSSEDSEKIIRDGFSLDFSYKDTKGKGVYLTSKLEKTREYGDVVLEVEIEKDSILVTELSEISAFSKGYRTEGFMFKIIFEEYTRSKGYKGIELLGFDEIVIYDLSCIQSIKLFQ
ncbi:MAG: hypothetical protein ACQEXX_01630 [Bacillota bacterium]